MHFVSQLTLPPSEASRVTLTRVFQQPVRKERPIASLTGSLRLLYGFARSITALVRSSRMAGFVLLAAQALAQRVVPLTRNSFETLLTITPCALGLQPTQPTKPIEPMEPI
jgi:hypothetical protein